jgi:hypothetical protein
VRPLLALSLLFSGCASVSPETFAKIGQGADVASTARVLRTTEAQELNPIFTVFGDEWWQVTLTAAGFKTLTAAGFKTLAVLAVSKMCGDNPCTVAWRVMGGFGLGAAAWNLSQGAGG